MCSMHSLKKKQINYFLATSETVFIDFLFIFRYTLDGITWRPAF